MPIKITVIGGSGFVGTNLCRRFAKSQQNFEIIDIKLSTQFPDKCKIGDVRDIKSLRDSVTGNIVINLAAVHRDNVRDKKEYHLTNVVGADNVAKICSELGIKKIVFTSTVSVYGFALPGTDETGKINPFNEYGKTKFAAEEIFRNWQKIDDNSLIIIRPTVIFGEGNRGNVFNLFKQIARGNFMMIGRGENKKSMAYIENVIAFLETCIGTDQKYALYNYIDTPNLTMNDLVSRVRHTLTGKSGVGIRLPYWLGLFAGYCADFLTRIIRKNLPISSVRVRKFTTNSEFVSSKANLNGFQAPYTLEEGLIRTLNSEFINPDQNREIFFTE